MCTQHVLSQRERDLFIDNSLVRIHFIIESIWWTSLAPWESEFLFQVAFHLQGYLSHKKTLTPQLGPS